MNCSHIISDMTWSYSRLTTYECCPYKFFLTYILKLDKKRLFFSDYGSFMHSIIEMCLNGDLKTKELERYYLSEFKNNVIGHAPNFSIFKNYFQQGLSYVKDFNFPYTDVIEVEKKIDFNLDGINFVGIIDAIVSNDGLIVLDNKSRALKHRSKKAPPTKADEELDRYLRQLYIYSAGIQTLYGEFPKKLGFNCFRNNVQIIENFDENKFNEAKKWAIDLVQDITLTTEWNPNIDYFFCNHLCDVCHHCEYSRFSERR